MNIEKWWNDQSQEDKAYTIGGILFLMGIVVGILSIKNEVGMFYAIATTSFGLFMLIYGKFIERKK